MIQWPGGSIQVMKKRIRVREPFCGISHFTGAVLSVAGLITLVIMARGRAWHTVAFSIYGVSLILLYTASCLYHSLHTSERGIEVLKRCDHIGIYLLIAGTYTPMCLVLLRGAWGWSMLGVEYGLAAMGIAAVLFWGRAPSWVRVVLYLCMGWLVVIAMGPVRQVIPPTAVAWLATGGILYTVGTVVYAAEWPNLWPGRFHAHDLWHVFVMAGSACHFVLMLRFVAPAA